jgi:hypothetical protein
METAMPEVGGLVFGLAFGSVAGFAWAQYLYRRMIAEYREICDSYHALLGRE